MQLSTYETEIFRMNRLCTRGNVYRIRLRKLNILKLENFSLKINRVRLAFKISLDI